MQNKKRESAIKPTPAFEERLRRIIREEVRNVYDQIRQEIQSGKSPPWPKVTYWADRDSRYDKW